MFSKLRHDCPRQSGELDLHQRIETPRSPALAGRGIFDRKEACYFQIRSLTPQQAAGNALAFAVQMRNREKGQIQESSSAFGLPVPARQTGLFGNRVSRYAFTILIKGILNLDLLT